MRRGSPLPSVVIKLDQRDFPLRNNNLLSYNANESMRAPSGGSDQ